MRKILIASAAIVALSIPTSSNLTLGSGAYAQQAKKKQDSQSTVNPINGRKSVKASGETYEQCVERLRAQGGGRRAGRTSAKLRSAGTVHSSRGRSAGRSLTG